jgi:hypothetical protein
VQREPWLNELGDRLHDLCQPLTALQFGLELGGMDAEPAAMQAAIAAALVECERMNANVHAMRYALRTAMAQG